MDKLQMMSMDKVQANIEKIKALFPNAVTEVLRNGKPTLAVDFDVLKQEMSDILIDDKEERYQFTWPDKKKSILLANSPISATLRPYKEESVDFDTTENLYIEGDNLDVLKLLQETYLGKVKMIYIDPPYNTGNDFVYNDDFAENAAEYLASSGQYDEQGNRLVQNTESNGRFHTDWLNMIYPRLKIAKDLLADDGVIFISIDDCEIDNLKKICNEIFSACNHVATILREAIKGGSQSKNIRNVHDYVVCYAKNIDLIDFTGIEVEGIELNLEDEYGKYARGRELNKWGAGSRREDAPSLFYPIPGPNGEDVYPIRNDGSEGRWRLGKQKMFELLKAGNAIFEPRGDGTYIVYQKIRDDSPKIKQFTTWFSESYINAKGTEEVKGLFQQTTAIFDFSKPSNLIKDLILMSNSTEGIILDFFSGSATTAHAVMQLNAEDGGRRKFICIQLPEVCDEKSEAYKAGYKTICEIGKERIRRAGAKIKEENGLSAQGLDVGFRVLKLDSSNMKEVYYRPEQYQQTLLDNLADNIKADRTPLDLLFQVMLDLGKPLSAKIEEKEIAGKRVFIVNDDDLIACFDDDVTSDVVKTIAEMKPLYAVFRDSSLADDCVGANFDQIFATYSPNTIRKVL